MFETSETSETSEAFETSETSEGWGSGLRRRRPRIMEGRVRPAASIISNRFK